MQHQVLCSVHAQPRPLCHGPGNVSWITAVLNGMVVVEHKVLGTRDFCHVPRSCGGGGRHQSSVAQCSGLREARGDLDVVADADHVGTLIPLWECHDGNVPLTNACMITTRFVAG